MIRTTYVGSKAILVAFFACTTALAQQAMSQPQATPATTTTTGHNTLSATVQTTAADTAATQLDEALAALNRGNKAAAVSALNAGVAAAEAQATNSKSDFKEKLMNQTGNLKKLIPGVSSGLIGSNALGKAVALVKMALGANQISSLLGESGSLLGSVGALTGGLNLMQKALPAAGGGQATAMGGTFISSALASINNLSGAGGSAAEPAVRQQLGGVLSFVKGLL